MLSRIQRYAIFTAILVVFAVARVYAQAAERAVLLSTDTAQRLGLRRRGHDRLVLHRRRQGRHRPVYEGGQRPDHARRWKLQIGDPEGPEIRNNPGGGPAPLLLQCGEIHFEQRHSERIHWIKQSTHRRMGA